MTSSIRWSEAVAGKLVSDPNFKKLVSDTFFGRRRQLREVLPPKKVSDTNFLKFVSDTNFPDAGFSDPDFQRSEQ